MYLTLNIIISVVTYLRFLSFSLSFWVFLLVRKGRRAWWNIFREEEDPSCIGFILMFIDVCTWLCNMCLICKHWRSMENGNMPWFWAFVFRVWRWAIIVYGHLRKIQGSLIGYYWVLSQNKNVWAQNLCMLQYIQVSLWEVRHVFVEEEYIYKKDNFSWE